MKRTVKVKFINLGHVERAQSRIKDVLERDYILQDSENPDYIIVGPHQTESLAPYENSILISESCEAVVPDFNLVDYAISFEDLKMGDRHFRMPISLANWKVPDKKPISDTKSLVERDFCNFFYSNPLAHPFRDKIFHSINDSYKKVDSLGRHLNNISKVQQQYWDNWNSKEDTKIDILRRYKFTLALENASHAGYVSEKILHAFEANTIPIYWGDPRVDDFINPDAFIWIKNEDHLPEAIKKIKEIDQSYELYTDMLYKQPLTINLEEKIKEEEAFIRNIFDQPIEKARRRGRGTFHDFYIRIHSEQYTRRWYRPGLIRKSQIWSGLKRLFRFFGIYNLLRPLGKKLRKSFHR